MDITDWNYFMLQDQILTSALKFRNDKAELGREQSDNFRNIFNVVFARTLTTTHVWKQPKDNKRALKQYPITQYMLGKIVNTENIDFNKI